MNPQMYFYATVVAAAISIMLFTYLGMVARTSGEVLATGTTRSLSAGSPLMGILLQIARLIAPLRAGVTNTAAGQEIDRKLRKAGRPFGMTVPEFVCLRYVGAVLGFGFAYFASVTVLGGESWPLMIGLAIFGFVYPTTKLNNAIYTRMVKIFRDLPYVLDMLTLSTEAGQDFTSAMKTVIDKGSPGPLLDEFRIVHQEVTLGKTRTEALRAMAARIDLPEMTSFVLALIQAEELGTSIGKVLRIMADQMRVKRSTLAEEMAGKVPVKLMMPLILLIVPAAFIVLLFGPVYMYMTGQQLNAP
jgi:tight adherence protein C